MTLCPFCGRIMQEDWIACPYCNNIFKCPNCKNEILKGWEICPYCAKILEHNSLTFNQHKNHMKKIELTKKSFSEKLVSIFPFQYYISWTIIGINFFSFFYLFQIIYDESMLIIPVLILSYLIAIQNIVIIWGSKSLENLYYSLETFVDLESSKLEDFYKSSLTHILDSKKSSISGFFVGIGVVITVLISSHPEINSLYIALAFYLIVYITAFFMGSGLYFMFTTAKFISDISKLKIKVSIYQHPSKSLNSTGKIFLKFFYLASFIVYIPWLLALYFSPWELNLITLSWFFVIGIISILYFIFPQYTIHKIMVKAKRDKENEVGNYLDLFDNKYTLNPSPMNINLLNELNQLKETIKSMDEWPFDIMSALSTISAIILPLTLILIQIWNLLKL